MQPTDRFEAFAARKAGEAAHAPIRTLVTLEDHTRQLGVSGIGNAWTRRAFDGDFPLLPLPGDGPAVSLVFVQSREGNTGARDPAVLGGGPTDLHLIYEGLSRVAADAVMAGAGTAAGTDVFFSVWHPDIVSLRRELGLPRHPAQIVVSRAGRIDLDRTLLFNVPDVPVFVIAGPECERRCQGRLAVRPWMTVVPLDGSGLRGALARLRSAHGIGRISAVGGRAVATSLIDEDLVQDLSLTTTSRSAGEPDTPFYIGSRRLSPRLIVRKREAGTDEPIVFEQLML